MRHPHPKWSARSTAAVTCALACYCPSLRAEAARDDWQLEALVTVHRYLPEPPSADPDQPAFAYGMIGGRWQAKLGDGLVLFGARAHSLGLAVALDGFVELANLTSDQPVPWQTYRANVGLELLADSARLCQAWLPEKATLSLGVGWFHESDHAAAQRQYGVLFLTPAASSLIVSDFDNGNLSSYEAVRLRVVYQQALFDDRLSLYFAPGLRLFPPAIDSRSVRALRRSGFLNARVSWLATRVARPFIAGYYESVKNDFVAAEHGFLFGANRSPLRYVYAELGLDLVASNGALVSPYLRYSNGHGRGIDFPRDYGSELGFGLVLLP